MNAHNPPPPPGIDATPASVARPVRPPKAISVRNFRLYFAGSIISVPGIWMQLTGQSWLILQLTNSPLSLAIVTSLQFLPVMLLSVFGGAISDRFPRRNLMIITQSLGAAQAILLGLFCATGIVTIWHIYLMAFVLGCINALDTPLRQSFVGDLVPGEYIPNAIAMNSLSQNIGRIVGPALGGLVIASFGASAAYLINAATFAGSLLALLLIRPSELQQNKRARPKSLFRQVGEAMIHVQGTPTILFLLIATAFIGMFGQNFGTIVPLISTYLVHASPAEFGVLNTCLGSGSLVAAAIMTTRGAPSARRILIAGFSFGAVLVAISFSSQLIVSGLMFFAVGAAAITFSASMQTSLQLWAPPDMRGRVTGLVTLLFPSPIGPLLTGLAASTIGVPLTVMLNGLLCCLGIGIAWAYLRYHKKRGIVFDHP